MTHAGSVATVEEDIINEGAQLIWVFIQDARSRPGTPDSCRAFVNNQGSDNGICVADPDTMPTANVFRNSPFAQGRGIDLIVRRSDMQVVFTAGHGTPRGNENLTGMDVLNELRALRE